MKLYNTVRNGMGLKSSQKKKKKKEREKTDRKIIKRTITACFGMNIMG